MLTRYQKTVLGLLLILVYAVCFKQIHREQADEIISQARNLLEEP